MKLSREMQRLRAKLLRGFNDLEGPLGDGPLSDRGNLHPVTESRDERERLAQRVADGAEYVAWAESVLHGGPGFRSSAEREAWRLHAEGYGTREIAPALTMHRRSVRRHLDNVKRRVAEVAEVRRWRNQKEQRKAQIRQLVRRADPHLLATLAAMMVTQRQGQRSPSR